MIYRSGTCKYVQITFNSLTHTPLPKAEDNMRCQFYQHFTRTFFYKSVMSSYLQLVFVFIWQKEIGEKETCKMLVQLTPGCILVRNFELYIRNSFVFQNTSKMERFCQFLFHTSFSNLFEFNFNLRGFLIPFLSRIFLLGWNTWPEIGLRLRDDLHYLDWTKGDIIVDRVIKLEKIKFETRDTQKLQGKIKIQVQLLHIMSSNNE